MLCNAHLLNIKPKIWLAKSLSIDFNDLPFQMSISALLLERLFCLLTGNSKLIIHWRHSQHLHIFFLYSLWKDGTIYSHPIWSPAHPSFSLWLYIQSQSPGDPTPLTALECVHFFLSAMPLAEAHSPFPAGLVHQPPNWSPVVSLVPFQTAPWFGQRNLSTVQTPSWHSSFSPCTGLLCSQDQIQSLRVPSWNLWTL